MAYVKKNIVTEGLSGTLGQRVVFRQCRNKTVVATLPDMTGRILSEAQQQQTSRFAQAVAYARQVLQDPAAKAACQAQARPGQSAYHAAIAHYLAPDRNDASH